MQYPVQKLLISALFASLLAACGTTPTTDSGAPVEDRNVGAGTSGHAFKFGPLLGEQLAQLVLDGS